MRGEIGGRARDQMSWHVETYGSGQNLPNIDIKRMTASFNLIFVGKGDTIRRFWYTWRCC